jgi:aryl-alcohol dehydrogenase-like predicted oxidoreductase
MKYRRLGNTELQISEISMGCWAIGGAWGEVSDAESERTLDRAADLGVNFFDTADVYGGGRSEKLVGALVRRTKTPVFVATKVGRGLNPHNAAGYTTANLASFVDRNLKSLGLERIDLLQLHCPPPEVYYRPEIFGFLDDLKLSGKIRHYGVSVEKVEEGLIALEYPGVRCLQIIFNLVRQRPAERLLARCQESGVGILARVPLASGLLTGKLTKDSQFEPSDHRQFNRHGEAFDVGETFSGVPWEVGLKAVDSLKELVPSGWSLGDFALKWILMHDAVTAAIPGAKTADQVAKNAAASERPPLTPEVMRAVRATYDTLIRKHVHTRW